jgi:hypothetical protein
MDRHTIFLHEYALARNPRLVRSGPLQLGGHHSPPWRHALHDCSARVDHSSRLCHEERYLGNCRRPWLVAHVLARPRHGKATRTLPLPTNPQSARAVKLQPATRRDATQQQVIVQPCEPASPSKTRPHLQFQSIPSHATPSAREHQATPPNQRLNPSRPRRSHHCCKCKLDPWRRPPEAPAFSPR